MVTTQFNPATSAKMYGKIPLTHRKLLLQLYPELLSHIVVAKLPATGTTQKSYRKSRIVNTLISTWFVFIQPSSGLKWYILTYFSLQKFYQY